MSRSHEYPRPSCLWKSEDQESLRRSVCPQLAGNNNANVILYKNEVTGERGNVFIYRKEITLLRIPAF